MNLKIKFNNIDFKNILSGSDLEVLEILNIRNEDNIRVNMFSKNLITLNEHLNWFGSLKTSKKNIFYLIQYNKKTIGGLGLKKSHLNSHDFVWSFYISQKIKIFGLGSLIELKAIDYFFSTYKISNLFCYVLIKNKLVEKLHRKFGFVDSVVDKNFNLLYPNVRTCDIFYLHLETKKWKSVKKKFYNKFLGI